MGAVGPASLRVQQHAAAGTRVLCALSTATSLHAVGRRQSARGLAAAGRGQERRMSGTDPPPPALLPPRSLIAKGQFGVCVMFYFAFAGFAGRQRVLGCCCSG